MKKCQECDAEAELTVIEGDYFVCDPCHRHLMDTIFLGDRESEPACDNCGIGTEGLFPMPEVGEEGLVCQPCYERISDIMLEG